MAEETASGTNGSGRATPMQEAKNKVRNEWILTRLRDTKGEISNNQLLADYKAAHDGVGVGYDLINVLRTAAGFPPREKKGGWPKGKPRGKQAPRPTAKMDPLYLDVARHMETHSLAGMLFSMDAQGALHVEVTRLARETRTIERADRRPKDGGEG
jgi:hypothetical protein